MNFIPKNYSEYEKIYKVRCVRKPPEVVEVAENTYGRFGFKSSRPISLTGVKFYGPAKANQAAYTVRLNVTQTLQIPPVSCIGRLFKFWYGSFYKIEEVLPVETTMVWGVKKGEMFTVNFSNPVEILADTLTDIKFELKGPKTEIAKELHTERNIILRDGSKVTLQLLNSGRQLDSIHFIVA